MRHLITALLLGSAILLAGCSSDDSSPNIPQQEPPVAETTADAGGGLLEYEGFALAVPAGSLDGEAALALYTEDDHPDLPAEAAGPVLRIEGIPVGVAQDFPLRLAHTSASGDSLVALVGQESWIPSLQQTVTTWQVADVTDSLGWAIFDLPVAGPAPDKAGTTAPITVTVVRGIASTVSADNHFKFYWFPATATNAQISRLMGFIDNAMAQYDFMGFQQEGFTDWPINVLVEYYDWFGHWAPDPRKLGGHLGFSTRFIDDPVELELTAGHELLHFCQYFYDPRSVYARGTVGSPQRWLDEATAVYIEDYYAPSEEYCSSARGGRELALLDGLLAPRTGRDLADHGYGLSSLIRYLYEAEPDGDDFILATYQDIKAGTHPAAALQANTTVDISDSWMEIIEELVAGNIYPDVTLSTLIAQPLIHEVLDINSAADTSGTTSWNMPDLSARIGYVNLNSYAYTQYDRLEFWADAAEYGLSVYGVQPPATLQFLSHAYGKVTLTNLPSLNQNYDQVMVLVTNQHFAGPAYDGTTSLNLEGRLRHTDPPEHEFTHGKIRIQYDADWSTSSSTLYNQEMNFVEVPGTFSGTSFSATWDSTGTNGVHYSGHITATMDPSDYHVLTWSARNRASMDSGASSDFQASGGELPDVTITQSSYDSRIEGAETCGAIGSLSVTYINDSGEAYRTLDGYGCSSGSYVKVILYDRR